MRNTLFLIIATLCFLSSCAVSSDMTGRKTMTLYDDQTMNAEAEIVYRDFLASSIMCQDEEINSKVQEVMNNIVKATQVYYTQNDNENELANFDFEVHVVENDEPNAWCMPGGKMVVYTGILPIIGMEDGLATVMGHEVAHALARHGNARKSRGQLVEIGKLGLDIFLAGKGESMEMRQQANTLATLGTQAAFLMPFSRGDEHEADEIGQNLMAIAGYDPREAPKVWANMEQAFGTAEFSIFATHPTHHSRKSFLEMHADESMVYAADYGWQQEDLTKPPTSNEPVLADNHAGHNHAEHYHSAIPKPIATAPTYSIPKSTSAPSETTTLVKKRKATEYKKKEISPGRPSANAKLRPMISKTREIADSEKQYKIQLSMVKTFRPHKYEAVQEYGLLNKEKVTWKGESLQRILLGGFTDLNMAKKVMRFAQRNGFASAFIVEYEHGERGERID